MVSECVDGAQHPTLLIAFDPSKVPKVIMIALKATHSAERSMDRARLQPRKISLET
jgi:hypothetical protein